MSQMPCSHECISVYNIDRLCDCDPGKTTTSAKPAESTLEPKPISNKMLQRFLKPTKKDDVETPEMLKLQIKKENLKRRKEEFLEKGIRTALYGAIEQKVQCAAMSTDYLLDQKRTRLRELLLAEEVAYTTEYISVCQQANIARDEELRNRAFELKVKSEKQQKEFAEQKLLERVIQSCDAARPVVTQKLLVELKKDQLWQIKEKYALEEAKREEDRMYHDLMMKNVLSLKEKEEENSKLAWIKQNETKKAFIEQMKWKEQKEQKERQLKDHERMKMEEEIRLIKEENAKEIEEKRLKKIKVKAEFHEQLQRDKEIKEKRKREEEEIDRTFNELLKLEEGKEKNKYANNKQRLKRERDIFLENSRELRRQKEEEERKFDEMLEKLNEKKRIQKDAERSRLKAAREELLCDVLKQRQVQIREKQERERKEEEQIRDEIQLLTLQIEQQNKIREDFEKRCAEQREQYRLQLLQQMQESEEARKKKKEEEDEYERIRKEEEEKEIENVKTLLRILPIGAYDHPMKTIVKQQPPKYTCPYPYPR